MMKHVYPRCYVIVVMLLLTMNLIAQTATITGPLNSFKMPATLGPGITADQVYTTEAGMTDYVWTVSSAGTITAPTVHSVSNTITVTWTNPTGQQTVSVKYTNPAAKLPGTATLIINYNPFPDAINPTTINQFVDPLPHFAAGLRVNAKNGGNLLIKTFMVQQVALSKGTKVTGGIIGTTPGAGIGNYAAYGISTDDGKSFGPAMWPAQTIEAQQGKALTVKYENGLAGIRYSDFNILADQTLMMNGYDLIGDPLTEPYNGDIPMVVHLHGGEMPSGSDGGPNAWFMPGFTQVGPAFKYNNSSSSFYPNEQEATTLWYHPHDDGLTRINVYTGLAGYYFLRGEDEEAAKFPGWSKDDLVRENTPSGDKYASTFNGSNAYLPEIEIAIQDRMFNEAGGLFWPVDPPNPEIHPFWTPEFVGDVMTVNGKSWPYLSVAPRKYRFRLLDGCNARFLDMWLADSDGNPGPVITVIGGEGGLLEEPVVLDPNDEKTLVMAPGQRYDVIIDFKGFEGKTFTLMNKAATPYPFGDGVVEGLTDRIMQFIVNGEMVSAADPKLSGSDKSEVPSNLRPVNPLVKLTDFSGGVNVKPDVHRQIILNEVSTDPGGPAAVLVNNSYFDPELSINPKDPYREGGPSEFQVEGTTEMFEVINVSADAHPIHIHLLQWQLVSRRPINSEGYLEVYGNAWKKLHPEIDEFPAGLGYPGGAGTPFPYTQLNGDKAIGGNPAPSDFFTGPAVAANPEERGWKDNVIVMPDEVTTFMVRVAPTDIPVNAPPEKLLFSFDPSEGPGYVWHCHIIDHEDMSMMRPLPILPSPLRYPQINSQPADRVACVGDLVSFSVAATSSTTIVYKWQVSADKGTTWTPLTNDLIYSGVTTARLEIKSAALNLNNNLYQCLLTNQNGTATSASALLTVNNCIISGTLKYNNSALNPIAQARVTIAGKTATTDALGAFTISGVKSGTYPVMVTHTLKTGGVNSTDAGSISVWNGTAIPSVNYLAGDVDKAGLSTTLDPQAILQNFVAGKPFVQAPWVYSEATATTSVIPKTLEVFVDGAPVTGFGILARVTGDYNGSFKTGTPGPSTVSLTSTGQTLKVPVGVPFDLPIKSVSGLQAGAVTLTLNIPSALVTINSVSVAGSSTPATWKLTGDALKIGWYSATPVSISAGGSLVTLNLTLKSYFSLFYTMKVNLVSSYLNELADGQFVPIPNSSLRVDNVMATTKPTNPFKLSMTPNPALKNSTVTINYTIPEAGNVTITVFDNWGILRKVIVKNQRTPNLVNSITASLSPLQRGSYYLNLTVTGNAIPRITTIKFVIK